ncbi:chorismate mutase [Panus rudis PR-1116 ss-1]|nr:chorismate mutase [Panus rudis PR-1116 ss-1]
MLGFSRLVYFTSLAGLVFAAAASTQTAASVAPAVTLASDTADTADSLSRRPFLTVPNLVQIRDILAQLEAPIISALTERYNLATPPGLYGSNGSNLRKFLEAREIVSAASGRYDYGRLEYPYTLPAITPDKATKTNTFPPGRFHQDKFTGNQELFDFYIQTLVPLFNGASSVFFHLDNSTKNNDATLNLDATLLELISHRSHIGKVVAETKFASNVTVFTDLIHKKDTTAIRTLLTNTTQEAGVLAQAATASAAFSNAWTQAGAIEATSFGGNVQNATAKLFRALIDITTDIEVQYILARLD